MPTPAPVVTLATVPVRTIVGVAGLAVGGLAGGFGVARSSGNRSLGGLVFAAAGAGCAREWARTSGPGAAAALCGLYLAAMGGSHPLAHRIGAWPSVAVVSAAVAAASAYVQSQVRAR